MRMDGTATAEQRSTAEAWVRMFAEGWSAPEGPDSFCDHFDPWLDPDVSMIQPGLRTVVGRRGFREEFARPLFDVVPDLHGTVEGWSASGDRVYIELRLQGTIGGRRFEMRTCDRITLRDGRAVERVAYLDAAPLLKAVMLSPRSWGRFARTQLRNLRRSS
jgi:ketosteroid isomerase-like protein